MLRSPAVTVAVTPEAGDNVTPAAMAELTLYPPPPPPPIYPARPLDAAAERMVEEEFDDGLALVRSTGVLTVVGQLDDDDEEEGEDEGADQDEERWQEDEEAVELLLSFEFEDREYNLVRLLEPVLMLGRVEKDGVRLLSEDERGEDIIKKAESFMMEAIEKEFEQEG